MKILVTGGCGFIGTNLVRYLLSETEHTVANLDKLTYAGNPLSLKDVADSPRYRFIQADLADAAAVEQAVFQFKPQAIMHLAAETHVDRSIDGPREFIQSNVVGTFNLLDAAHRYLQGSEPPETQNRFRFLHVSTDEVYGTLGAEGAFTESSRYDPHSPYSATKASADHLARAWHDTYRLPVIVTNCSNNFGPYQFPEKLIPLMILKCLREEPLPVYGQGTNVRDWLPVEDHVRALLLALTAGKAGETYNIGGHGERRNIDLVRAVCSILDELRPREGERSYQELISFVPDRPGHDYRYAIDSEKIRVNLGWSPQYDVDSYLRSTIMWYLENQPWCQDVIDGTYRLQRLGDSGHE